MNLLTLYYFVELARELHVTNTAQKLYISQQNLSQHIQRLEQHYGVSLFHRKPKLALTYEGEQLYAVAVKILAEEHEFMNRLADISANSWGSPPTGERSACPASFHSFMKNGPISPLSCAANPPAKWRKCSAAESWISSSASCTRTTQN